jgi:hypothetical protein
MQSGEADHHDASPFQTQETIREEDEYEREVTDRFLYD